MTIFGRPRILVIVTLLAGTWLLIAGSIACSETDLEPTLSGQGAAGQETRPSDDWPALQPAPSKTPTPEPGFAGSQTGAPGVATNPSSFLTPTMINSDIDGVTPTPGQVGFITPTPWDVPSRFPTPTPLPPPPGLIYEDENGLWQIGENWQAQFLGDTERWSILSPDGAQVLFLSGDDIWLQDLESGEQQNLTEGYGRVECCLSWWSARPDTIVFGSRPDDDDLGPSAGFLSAIDLDDGSYRILDDQIQSNANAAPGPDGLRVAYDRAGEAWLYHWELGPQPLDMADYGMDIVVRIGGPAWSPDGRRIAWTAAILSMESDPWKISLVVIDLETGDGRLLHPYDNVGRGGWFDPPVWSPDGQWIAFIAEDINLGWRGLWVVAADGSGEHYLGPGSNPFFSPDNQWLAYTAYSLELDPAEEIRLVEIESWYSTKMDLPAGSNIRDWR